MRTIVLTYRIGQELWENHISLLTTDIELMKFYSEKKEEFESNNSIYATIREKSKKSLQDLYALKKSKYSRMFTPKFHKDEQEKEIDEEINNHLRVQEQFIPERLILQELTSKIKKDGYYLKDKTENYRKETVEIWHLIE